MQQSSIAALKRYVEQAGSIDGASDEIGVDKRTISAFARSDEGRELIESWLTVYRLRTWRVRPDIVRKALDAVEHGLDGVVETHTKRVIGVVTGITGSPVIDPETGKPKTYVKAIETRKVRKAPDVRYVNMVLGGVAETPRSQDEDNAPVIKISDNIDDAI